MWHVTRDTWHVTRDTWHVTCDTWHGVVWIFSQNFSCLALTVWDLWCVYRTAPATLGLLKMNDKKIYTCFYISSNVWLTEEIRQFVGVLSWEPTLWSKLKSLLKFPPSLFKLILSLSQFVGKTHIKYWGAKTAIPFCIKCYIWREI